MKQNNVGYSGSPGGAIILHSHGVWNFGGSEECSPGTQSGRHVPHSGILRKQKWFAWVQQPDLLQSSPGPPHGGGVGGGVGLDDDLWCCLRLGATGATSS
mmetsp:Transcript_22956/g.66435  ORF Transcript_22956/g.66435 Transcript_22956/m.66435 type:complete len:100 (-) Transcript_22956:564-863(-)